MESFVQTLVLDYLGEEGFGDIRDQVLELTSTNRDKAESKSSKKKSKPRHEKDVDSNSAKIIDSLSDLENENAKTNSSNKLEPKESFEREKDSVSSFCDSIVFDYLNSRPEFSEVARDFKRIWKRPQEEEKFQSEFPSKKQKKKLKEESQTPSEAKERRTKDVQNSRQESLNKNEESFDGKSKKKKSKKDVQNQNVYKNRSPFEEPKKKKKSKKDEQKQNSTVYENQSDLSAFEEPINQSKNDCQSATQETLVDNRTSKEERRKKKKSEKEVRTPAKEPLNKTFEEIRKEKHLKKLAQKSNVFEGPTTATFETDESKNVMPIFKKGSLEKYSVSLLKMFNAS